MGKKKKKKKNLFYVRCAVGRVERTYSECMYVQAYSRGYGTGEEMVVKQSKRRKLFLKKEAIAGRRRGTYGSIVLRVKWIEKSFAQVNMKNIVEKKKTHICEILNFSLPTS